VIRISISSKFRSVVPVPTIHRYQPFTAVSGRMRWSTYLRQITKATLRIRWVDGGRYCA